MYPPAGWYSDPVDQNLVRWWDGNGWTGNTALVPQPRMDAAQNTGLLDASPLFIRQTNRRYAAAYRYEIRDGNGVPVGFVDEVGQSGRRKFARVISGWGQFYRHRLEVRTSSGELTLSLLRPGTTGRTTAIVTSPDGMELGRLEQAGRFTKPHFDLVVAGQVRGTMDQLNRGFFDFRILDQSGREIARTDRDFETGEYSLLRAADLVEPYRSLTLGAVLVLDLAYAHIAPVDYVVP